MGDEGWGGGLFFSTDPKCLWIGVVRSRDQTKMAKKAEWNKNFH